MFKISGMKTEPTICEKFADNGEHSHWELINTDTGETLWKEGQSSPKIKQLEWDFYGAYYSAETPVGHYVILQGDELHLKSFLTYLLTYNGILIADFNRFEEAKAAAQADFEKRIKECLDL